MSPEAVYDLLFRVCPSHILGIYWLQMALDTWGKLSLAHAQLRMTLPDCPDSMVAKPCSKSSTGN